LAIANLPLAIGAKGAVQPVLDGSGLKREGRINSRSYAPSSLPSNSLAPGCHPFHPDRRGAVSPLFAVDVGVARIDVIPAEPIRLTGYGNRTTNSIGIEQKLWAKALAIGTDGEGRRC
jgi:hypothetical protein